jgi:dolichol-phosphate mannosyltransferase
MDLSLVIPCFNEAEGVDQMRIQFDAVRPTLDSRGTWELLFVDDGSTDDTFEKISIAFASWDNVRIVRHERNLGLAAGLRTGFSHAQGDIIVVTDSDGTYPFTTIPEMLDLMTADVDIVTSSAYHPQGGVDGVPPSRLLFSQSASLIYRVLVDWRIHTYTAMYRAYPRQVVEKLSITTEGYLVMAQLLVDALLGGYRVAEYPATLRVRRYGQSKAKVWRITRQHLGFQAGVLWRRLTEPRQRLRRA